jgi:uncharacterized protein YbjT (DUF2867 family)
MIVLIGASGTIGSELVRLLAEGGYPVRALVHNPQKVPAVAAPGVEVIPFDFEQPSLYAEALRDAERLFLLTPAGPRQVEIETALIQAARRLNARHIVKMSALGARADSPVPFTRWHGRIEQFLEDSDIPYTCLRPHFFMQNFFLYAQSVALDSLVAAPAGSGRIGMIDARDIAAVAAAVLTEKGHEGKAYDLTGPEALSFEDAVRRISAATGRTVTYLDVAPERARERMLDEGMPEWHAEAMLALYEVYRAGRGEAVTSTVAQVAGRRPRSFDEFALDYAEKFKPPGERAE